MHIRIAGLSLSAQYNRNIISSKCLSSCFSIIPFLHSLSDCPNQFYAMRSPQSICRLSTCFLVFFTNFARSLPPNGENDWKDRLLARQASSTASSSSAAPTTVCTNETLGIACVLPNEPWQACQTGYTGPWDSASNGATFPTTNNIKSDMIKCGNVGNIGPTIFYSFGATTIQARGFRDTLSPRGVMFNDALPASWTFDLSRAVNLAGQDRQAILVARIAQAMAELSKGEVFFFAPAFADPYTIPNPGPPNVWRSYEFPTLQRNTGDNAITRITKVINESPYARSLGWQPNDPQFSLLPSSNADAIVSSNTISYIYLATLVRLTSLGGSRRRRSASTNSPAYPH